MEETDIKMEQGSSDKSPSSGKKRGPAPRYQIRGLYYLPPYTPFPMLRRDHKIVAKHMQHGYGFPPTHFDPASNTFKKVSLPVATDESAFRQMLKGFYENLCDDFDIYTVTKANDLYKIPPNVPSLTWLKSLGKGRKGYQGILVIKDKEEDLDKKMPRRFQETSEANEAGKPSVQADGVSSSQSDPELQESTKQQSFQAVVKEETDPETLSGASTMQTRSKTGSLKKPARSRRVVKQSRKKRAPIVTKKRAPTATKKSAPATTVKSIPATTVKSITVVTKKSDIDISPKVLNQWRAVGATEGLKTDTQIASFFVKLYETVKNGPQVSAVCATCNSPLRLACPTCSVPQISELDTGEANAQEEAQQLEVQNTDGFVTIQITENATAPKPETQSDDGGGDLMEANADSDAEGVQGTPTQQTVDGQVVTESPAQSSADGRPKRKRRSKKKDPLFEMASPVPKKRKPKPANRVCELCGKAFISPGLLAEHMLIHTGEKPHSCEICSMKFRVKRQLKIHMEATHSGRRPYLCALCGKAFGREGSLALHMRAHRGIKKWVCNVCGAAFMIKSQLELHNRVHLDLRPFPCNVCGFSFREKSKLKEHMRIHTGEKPFKCSQCSAAFGRKKNLVLHERRHNQDKPFRCEICGYCCVDSAILKVHSRVHTGEKNYVCNVCNASFGYNGALKNHMKRHENHLLYPCSECGMQFHYLKDLKIHSQTEHNINKNEMPVTCVIPETAPPELNLNAAFAGEQQRIIEEPVLMDHIYDRSPIV